MLIYILVLLLLCFLMVKYDFYQKPSKDTSNKEKRWQIVVVVVLILLAGLRNHVGGDTFNYENHFIYDTPKLGELFQSHTSFENLSQPLWFLINVLSKTLWDDFITVQFFHAIILNLLLYRFIRHSTRKVFTVLTVSYCILWWNFNFEVLREALCVAFFLNGLICLKERKVGLYLLWCLPALGIHYFSFVMILLALLFYFASSKIIIFVTALLFVLLSAIDTNQLSSLIISLAVMAVESKEDLLESYILGETFGTTELNVFGVLLTLVSAVFPLIIVIKSKMDPFYKRMIWLFLILFIFQAKYPIISRFSNYLWLVVLIEAVNYLYTSRKKDLFRTAVLCLLIYNVVHYSLAFYNPPEHSPHNKQYDVRYIPYKSVFQSPDPVRELYYSKD